MVSHDLPEIATARPFHAEIDPAAWRGAITRVLQGLQQSVCGIRGHKELMHFDHDRVYLSCASCGHESPGWTVDSRRPRLRFAGDSRRHRMNVRESAHRVQ